MPRDAPEPIRLPALIWQDLHVLSLCRNRDANGLFKLARKYGVSNERAAYWTGTGAGEISKRINDRITGPVVSLDRWLRIADGLNMPDHARRAIGLATGPSPKTAPRSGAAIVDSDLSISGRAITIAADESAQFAEWAEAANTGRFSVGHLAAELRQLSAAYLTGRHVQVFMATRIVRDKTIGLLRGHSAPARAADLYTLAGYSCTLLAWMSGDLGRADAADTHARTAWLCADLANSDELRAWVLATQSKTAFWEGRLGDAADLARAGRSLACMTGVAVLLAAQEADAAASMGRTSGALGAVHEMSDIGDAVTAPDAVGGLLSCDLARQGNYAAAVYARIGWAGDALREAGSALASYRDDPEHARGTEMQLRISLALGHLADGGLDGVADALAPVFAEPPERRLATVAKRMAEVTAALDAGRFAGSRQADTVRKAITDFRSVRPSLPPAIEENPGVNR